MPLPKDRLIVPLGVGLNTELDDKLVAPGSVLTLENAFSDRTGRIVKRPGFRVAARPESALDTGPFREGMVLWTKGDFEMVTNGADKMRSQGNAASPTFNPGFHAADDTLGPTLGEDELDGVPGTTWPLTPASNHVRVSLEPADGSGAVHLKDRDGNLFGYDTGETQTITWLAVVIPRLDPDTFDGILGGTVFRLGRTAGGGQLDLELIFRIFVGDLSGIGTESLTAYSNDWTDDYLNAIYGPDTPAATYDGIPMLLHFESGARDDCRLYVSGPGIGTKVELALSPGTLPVVSAHNDLTSSYGTVNLIASDYDRWIGARFEDICYDFKLSDNVAAQTQTYAYLASRFPSLGL